MRKRLRSADILFPRDASELPSHPGLRGTFTFARVAGEKTLSFRPGLFSVCGRVAELADAKDLGSFGAILAGSTPVAPTNQIKVFRTFSLYYDWIMTTWTHDHTGP